MFDAYTTYSDPNVQAWAQYYIHGGNDPAGTVYFFSVPGITDGAAPPPQQQQKQQQQGQQQQGHIDSQYQYQEHQAGSTASLGSITSGAGAPVDNTAASSPPSSPQQSVPSSHSAERAQAVATANYAAYPTGGGTTTTTQAQQYAAQQQPRNRQPLSKASLTSLPGGAVYASPTGGNAALPLQASAASMGPGGPSGAPSWVIPKKAVAGPTSRPESPIQQASVSMAASGGGGGYAPDPAAAPGQPYYALSNQFAGMSVADQQQHH